MKIKPKPNNKRTIVPLVGMVFLMGLLSFASVPMYDWFCRVTGYGGTPNTAETNNSKVLENTIKVRFDASLERNMPWNFEPLQYELEINVGDSGIAFYEAFNPTDRPVAGQASFNVVPFSAGQYFTKVECFCFVEQVLQPGEKVTMPVSFYIDPEIVNDREAKFVNSVTLSYTFYEIDLPEDYIETTSADKYMVNKKIVKQ
tara:strand:+ start:109 stop:711 length:603 start_codon:yes stop_codon:yes gene_type:complete